MNAAAIAAMAWSLILAAAPADKGWEAALAAQLAEHWNCTLVALEDVVGSRPVGRSFMTATAQCADHRAFTIEGPNDLGIYLVTVHRVHT